MRTPGACARSQDEPPGRRTFIDRAPKGFRWLGRANTIRDLRVLTQGREATGTVVRYRGVKASAIRVAVSLITGSPCPQSGGLGPA